MAKSIYCRHSTLQSLAPSLATNLICLRKLKFNYQIIKQRGNFISNTQPLQGTHIFALFLNKSNFDIESASTKPLLDNQSSRHWVVSAAILGRLAKRPRLPPRPALKDLELNPSLLPSLTLKDAILLQLNSLSNMTTSKSWSHQLIVVTRETHL